jgi:glucokinase
MSTDESVAIGVELAGRGARVALVDSLGRVRRCCPARTLQGRPALATLQPHLRALEAMLAYARDEHLGVRGLGICVPGNIDGAARRPLLIPTLPSLNDFPLCDFLEARYGLPCSLHVDVDAALLGEQQFGAGKGFRRLLFLTLNAVVGAALVVDGKLQRSAQQYVGHISHLPVGATGPRCSCGKRGCINTLISMEAMQKMVLRAVRRGEETGLTQRLMQREYFSPQLLAEEARRGDSVALWVYGEVGRWLAAATAKYITLFEPHILILGGNVVGGSDVLLQHVREALSSQPSSRVSTLVEVVPAQLGGDAALVGAVIPLF